jgi:hypothetical protein
VFEDEFSAAAKYDYAIATGLAGVGIWTLDNDRTYPEMYNVLKAKFYDPTHRMIVGAQVGRVTLSGGLVRVSHVERAKNVGNVPERGRLIFRIWDRSGHLLKRGSVALTIYPGRTKTIRLTTAIGSTALRAGTYRLQAWFVASTGTWRSAVARFWQPY